MSDHKIYENTYIGYFIFVLGMISERRRLQADKKTSIAINLYQQTPADPMLGDFFSSVNGRYLLIEFKKDQAPFTPKEKKKQIGLTGALKKDKYKHLGKVHYRCHFLGTGNNNGIDADISFKSYLVTPSYSQKSICMKDFMTSYCDGTPVLLMSKLNSTEDENHSLGGDSVEFRSYLGLLKDVYSVQEGASTGGLIVNLSEAGDISCLSSPDINSLVLKLIELYDNTPAHEVKSDSRVEGPVKPSKPKSS